MKIIGLNSENFKQEVLQSPIPVVVDFFADWCGPCQAMGAILKDFAASLDEKKLKLASLNIDLEQDLAREYAIASIPCLILFKDGKEVDRSIGLVSRQGLEKFCQQ